MMKEDFELWFPSANDFFKYYKYALNDGDFKKAAFFLHQATESYMTCYLLVKTLYKEKTHDLGYLYKDLIRNDEKFKNWFDLKDEKEF